MKLTIVLQIAPYIDSITEDISNDVSFELLSLGEIEELKKKIIAGDVRYIWSDRHYEEPNEICYIVFENNKFVEIHDDLDVLYTALCNHTHIYKVEVEYYI